MPLRKPSKTLIKSEVACAGDVSKGVLRIKRASGKQMRLMGALIFSGAITSVSRPLPQNANPRPGSMISFVGLQPGSKKLRDDQEAPSHSSRRSTARGVPRTDEAFARFWEQPPNRLRRTLRTLDRHWANSAPLVRGVTGEVLLCKPRPSAMLQPHPLLPQ